jgi:hypothetical protein
MGQYDDAVAFLERVEDASSEELNSHRERFTARQIDEIREQFPGIPEDFLAYLSEIGSGPFRECQFTVYAALTPAEEIFEEGLLDRELPAPRFLCFGDDFAGAYSGFLPEHGWAVAELWLEDRTTYQDVSTFGEYIRDRMLMGAKGEDLRA